MDKLEDYPAPKHLNQHHWTNHEKIFKRKARIQNEISDLIIPLRSGLLYKLSKSIFGSFLEELNHSQNQNSLVNDNKFQILNWHLKRYSEHDKGIIQKRNSFMRDYYQLLKKAVDEGQKINLEYLAKYLRSLNLSCCFVKTVDRTLQPFHNLQILTLCGNFLTDIPGRFLPRNLLVLDLFDNFISDLTNLLRNAPKTIQSLGLARNRLKDDSNLHLLAKTGTFPSLKNIDLSDNDICDLQGLVETLKPLQSITALSLEGNPCWVLPNYKETILRNLRRLMYLDFTEVLDEDLNNLDKKAGEPQVIFHCFRILGLPEPPKDDLEPLKDETVSVKTEESGAGSDKRSKKDPKTHKDKHINKEKDAKKTTKEKGKKSKKKSLYAGQNEYSEEEDKRNVWLRTEPMHWAKIMEFPSINIPHPDIIKIRDTFRSIVPIRIVYLKVAPYNPKQKKSKTPKKKDKSNKRKSLVTVEELQSHEESTKEEKKDEILTRVVLASFYCDLKSANWSDETLDFYWADHPNIGDKAVCVEGSLKAIVYELNSGGKKGKNHHAGSKGVDEGHQKEFLPNVLTCQVGFGLNRGDL
ncbi:leucine-rich repeat-containing protein 43-like isoform X2 [Anthonomus grandis grandis]|uniref:leucine-rich repeat-containing protein 43-like isoform X2 n=1 Tax=Anthonomus grandis grandis TaxID=2921223 RepID=UPI0021651F04|nr:leucine-rich repeat-containing protein 43-like isoform X2 [Anthonomus grandis grandis]